MNELIKELADQAGVRSIYGNEADNIQKFAELLVKECAKVAFGEAPTDESACDISSAINEHFGVT